MNLARRPALAAVALLVVGGCATIGGLLSGHIDPPSLSVVGADLQDATLSEATVGLHLKVNNPNGRSLSVGASDYAIAVDGHPLAVGKPKDNLEIPAHGTTEVVLPATFRFSDVAGSVQQLLARGKVNYRAEGHLGVNSPVGLIRLPFSHQGDFDLPKVPSVNLGDLHISKVSLVGATLQIPVQLQNSNPFPLPLGALKGALYVGGARVGSVAVAEVGKLGARGSKEATRLLTLPLEVRFAGAYSAAQAIQSGHALVQLLGQLSSGSASVPIDIKHEVDLQQ